MKIQEFENATDAELRQKAIECFEQADSVDHLVGSILLPKARFFLDEIERRKNDMIGRRDFRMELIVIFLIGLELVTTVGLAVWGERDQAAQVQKQLAAIGQVQIALSNLDKSSQATADTLATLEKTTETMNTALQKQLGLFYDVSVNVVYDEPKKMINVINGSRTNIQLWGLEIGGVKPKIDTEGRTIEGNNAGWEFDVAPQYEALRAKGPQGQMFKVPFELFLKNERGEEFVVHCYMGTIWNKDTMTLSTETTSVTPERWSREYPIPQKPEPPKAKP